MSTGFSSEEKLKTINEFRRTPSDCGSTEVQVALLTRHLQKLVKHFEQFPKDNHSRRGMLQLISKRKGLLNYLRRESPERYRKTLAALGLRK